jgi:hypothetical protein
MTHGMHHGHGGLGLFAIVAAIAFAFGIRTARIVVGSVLLAGVAFFGYVVICVWMGMI